MRTKEQIERARELTEQLMRVTRDPAHGMVLSSTSIALNWVLGIEGPDAGDGLTEMLASLERKEVQRKAGMN